MLFRSDRQTDRQIDRQTRARQTSYRQTDVRQTDNKEQTSVKLTDSLTDRHMHTCAICQTYTHPHRPDVRQTDRQMSELLTD